MLWDSSNCLDLNLLLRNRNVLQIYFLLFVLVLNKSIIHFGMLRVEFLPFFKKISNFLQKNVLHLRKPYKPWIFCQGNLECTVKPVYVFRYYFDPVYFQYKFDQSHSVI